MVRLAIGKRSGSLGLAPGNRLHLSGPGFCWLGVWGGAVEPKPSRLGDGGGAVEPNQVGAGQETVSTSPDTPSFVVRRRSVLQLASFGPTGAQVWCFLH